MNRFLWIVFTLLTLTACSTQQPILNISGSPVPPRADGNLLTLPEVNKAILIAAKTKGWTPTNLDDHTIEASITVRGRHTATVDISYSERSYDINLKSSMGLDQKAGQIHRNYNKWVQLLDQQIQIEMLDKSIN